MGNVFYFPWEIDFMTWLQQAAGGFTGLLGQFFTLFGEETLLVFILSYLYWCRDKDLAKRMIISLSGSMMLGSIFKIFASRLRPYMAHEQIKCVRAPHPTQDIMDVQVQGYSFPSVHSSNSGSVYTSAAIRLKNKKWTWICAAIILLVGLSRCFLGAHYPTDVLVGWVLGIGMAFLSEFLINRFGFRVTFLLMSVIGVVGMFIKPNGDFCSVFGLVLGTLLGTEYEQKYVNFKMPVKWWCCVLRVVLGIGLFLLCKEVLKKLFALIPGDPESALILLVRQTVRYMLSTFVMFGLYPRFFVWMEKKGRQF